MARTGQAVEFRNSESIVHNVYVTRGGSGTEVLNVGTDPGQSHAHTFEQPGRYDVSCDIHPGMMAAIMVVNNLRDIDTDRRAGKNTLAVILGRSPQAAFCVSSSRTTSSR